MEIYVTGFFLVFACVVGVMNFIATSKEIRIVSSSDRNMTELAGRIKMLEIRIAAIERRCLGEDNA